MSLDQFYKDAEKLAAQVSGPLGSLLIGKDPFAPLPKGDIPVQEVTPRILVSDCNKKEISVVPGEWLRDRYDSIFSGAGSNYREFLSSGTTGAHQSHSRFSALGLDLYRVGSLRTFFHVLSSVHGEGWESLTGYSLIPPTSEWGDSSLAQMIQWVGGCLPLEYLSAQEIKKIKSERPVWIFATAFHLINAIDGGLCTKLPPGSIIIETGGTKGRSRQLGKQEFYALISKHFAVPLENIIGEYGMCELASQAYDWVGKNGARKGFRFPRWCQIYVCNQKDSATTLGEGSLLIHDQLRIDLPGALLTEDMARLENDNFQLLGRIPRAPLKGCSMKAEVNNRPTEPPKRLVSSPSENSCEPIFNIELAEKIEKFLANEEASTSLAKETGSLADATSTLQYLIEDLPKSHEEWRLAFQNAHRDCSLNTWLIISASTHSLAALYPVVLGLVGGLTLFLRVHENNHFLRLFTEKFPLRNLQVLPSTFRLGVDQLPENCEAALVYGEDSTITELESFTQLPLNSFGSTSPVIVANEREVLSHAKEIVRDAFSLGQLGCLNARLLLVEGENLPNEDLWTGLSLAFKEYWQQDLPLGLRCQISRQGLIKTTSFQLDENCPLFYAIQGPISPVSFANTQLTLPTMRFMTNRQLEDALISLQQRTLISGTKKRSLGDLQRHKWDGFWLEKRLFSFTMEECSLTKQP